MPAGVPSELIEESSDAPACRRPLAATAAPRSSTGVTVEVPSDGVAAVMGHNGVGNTTLLRAAVGLLKCTVGKALFDGNDITKLRPGP